MLPRDTRRLLALTAELGHDFGAGICLPEHQAAATIRCYFDIEIKRRTRPKTPPTNPRRASPCGGHLVRWRPEPTTSHSEN